MPHFFLATYQTMHSLKRLIYALEQQHGPSIESRRSFNRLIGGGKRKLEDNSGSSAPKKQKSNSMSTQTITQNISEIFKEEICPICQERIGDDLLILPCGHMAHPLCLAKWVKQSNQLTCPVCRQDPAQLLPKRFYDGYSGQSKNGIANGKGIKTFPNGNEYEGEWRNGKAEGTGTLTGSSGSTYVGDFQNGKRHGRGIYTWPSGNTYEGEWKNGMKHGRGIYKRSDLEYKGEYQNDTPHGKGTLTFPNGDTYEGDFQNGKRHGIGITTMKKNGWTHKGRYENDKKNGKGILTVPKKGTLNGTWKNDKQDGKFIITYEDGKVEEAIWKNGNRIKK